jgi:hypothetical protein
LTRTTIRPMPRIRRRTQRHRMPRIMEEGDRYRHMRMVDTMILTMDTAGLSREALTVIILHMVDIIKDTTTNEVITILHLIPTRTIHLTPPILMDILLVGEVTTILILHLLATMPAILALMMSTNDTITTTDTPNMSTVSRKMINRG